MPDRTRPDPTYTLWPGSRAANDAGCTCPILDNAHGDLAAARDRGGWWQHAYCPVHGTLGGGRSAPVPDRSMS